MQPLLTIGVAKRNMVSGDESRAGTVWIAENS